MKVYVPEAVLLTVAGDHVPVNPLLEVPGKLGAAVPEQNAAMAVNVGVAGGPTTTVIVTGVAHCPAEGVKV